MAEQDLSVPVPLPPDAGISFGQRLWSDECAIADAIEGRPLDERQLEYRFSNGRRFLAE